MKAIHVHLKIIWWTLVFV